jgi:membrane protein
MTAWAGSAAPWVAGVLVLVGALSVFAQFVAALDQIWGTGRERPPVRTFLRQRGLALALLGVAAGAFFVAFVVALVLTIMGAVLFSFAAIRGIQIAGVTAGWASRGVVVLVASAVLFEVSFTVAPDRPIRWRDSLTGALATALLFTIGEVALSAYLGTTQRFNVFGTLQVFVGLIVWIYYSALVALWGAELTRLLVLRAETRRERVSTG